MTKKSNFLLCLDTTRTILCKCSTKAKKVTIPLGITTIEKFAFSDCTFLVHIEIPNSVTTISEYAFYACSTLSHIDIPASVTCIEENVFQFCSSLQQINVAKENPIYTSINGVLFSRDKKHLFYYPQGKADSYYSISSGVSIIKADAFAYKTFL